jgi:membrane peptidoglycan carboxypeptidase
LFLVALVGFGLAVLALSVSVRVAAVPAPSEISVAQTSILYYDDGVTELGRLGEANRVSVNLEQIPLFSQQAILAAEDRDFYNHGGFSIRGISLSVHGISFPSVWRSWKVIYTFHPWCITFRPYV